MPVAFNNAAHFNGTASAASASMVLTAAANSILLVATQCPVATTISSVAANGNALTRRSLVTAGSGIVELWVLTAPPSGNLSISYNTAGSQPRLVSMVAASYTGHKAVGPLGTIIIGTAVAATVNVSVSCTADDIVAAFWGAFTAAAVTANNGTTRRSATCSTSARMVLADVVATSSAVSLSATAATSTTWGFIGVPIKFSAAAVASVIIPHLSLMGCGA